MDTKEEGYRKRGFRTGGMRNRRYVGQDRTNAGKEGCRTGGMQDWRDAGKDRCRKGQMQERRDEEKEG